MALYPNIKVIPIWLLRNGDLFSWSITMRPLCRLLKYNFNTCMYEYIYLDKPEKIRYSRINRTICIIKETNI